MTPEEEEKLLEKLDAMEKEIESLKTPPTEVDENKEDTDPRIEKTVIALRKSLLTHFSQEKLDAMTWDELLIADSMKQDFKPPVGIIPPTGSGTQKQDTGSNIPESFRAHFSLDSDLQPGELI